LFINGEYRPAKNGGTFPLMRPSDGSQLATVAAGSKADIDDAVKAASAASSSWASRRVSDRAVLLHRLADAIERDKEILARVESRDIGKPYHEALLEIGFAASGYRYYADVAVHSSGTLALALPHLDARQVHLPRGVCGFIIPWNAPFILFASGCGPALAAGNTVVLKAPELAPLTCVYLAGVAKEVGFPPGVINVVPGLGPEAGAALAAHPGLGMISFTGSPATGKSVAASAAANLTPSKLELGGKGAAVVFPDVDVPHVASQLTAAIVRNAGQMCCTATRWIIHEDIMSDFLARVNKSLESVRVGPDESDADLGAVISQGQRQRIMKYLQAGREQGAKVLFDGGTEPVAATRTGITCGPLC
jgi:acyl-CoA reductase-like NAD-dependent aldehyde dehydrogenase